MIQPMPQAPSLRPGTMYATTTTSGRSVVGEYLGIEVAHGEWAFLIHTSAGVVSIPLATVASVVPTAA